MERQSLRRRSWCCGTSSWVRSSLAIQHGSSEPCAPRRSCGPGGHSRMPPDRPKWVDTRAALPPTALAMDIGVVKTQRKAQEAPRRPGHQARLEAASRPARVTTAVLRRPGARRGRRSRNASGYPGCRTTRLGFCDGPSPALRSEPDQWQPARPFELSFDDDPISSEDPADRWGWLHRLPPP